MLSLKEYFLVGKLGGFLVGKFIWELNTWDVGIQKTKLENKNIFPGNNGYLKFIDGKWFKKNIKLQENQLFNFSCLPSIKLNLKKKLNWKLHYIRCQSNMFPSGSAIIKQ